MTLYVDPPEGWRYGFPKAVPKDREADIMAWIIKEGYPPEKIQEMGDNFVIRCWREENETS